MRIMSLNHVKLGLTVTFMKYLASVVSFIFLPKPLTWNKITLLLSNLLNLIINDLTKSVSKKFANIPFSFRFITACCKDCRRV